MRRCSIADLQYACRARLTSSDGAFGGVLPAEQESLNKPCGQPSHRSSQNSVFAQAYNVPITCSSIHAQQHADKHIHARHSFPWFPYKSPSITLPRRTEWLAFSQFPNSGCKALMRHMSTEAASMKNTDADTKPSASSSSNLPSLIVDLHISEMDESHIGNYFPHRKKLVPEAYGTMNHLYVALRHEGEGIELGGSKPLREEFLASMRQNIMYRRTIHELVSVLKSSIPTPKSDSQSPLSNISKFESDSPSSPTTAPNSESASQSSSTVSQNSGSPLSKEVKAESDSSASTLASASDVGAVSAPSSVSASGVEHVSQSSPTVTPNSGSDSPSSTLASAPDLGAVTAPSSVSAAGVECVSQSSPNETPTSESDLQSSLSQASTTQSDLPSSSLTDVPNSGPDSQSSPSQELTKESDLTSSSSTEEPIPKSDCKSSTPASPENLNPVPSTSSTESPTSASHANKEAVSSNSNSISEAALEDSRRSGLGRRILLYGPLNSGKSIALLSVVEWARASGWIVMYISSCDILLRGNFFAKRPESNHYDTIIQAQMVLKAMLQNHGEKLKKLPKKLGSSGTLYDYCVAGMSTETNARLAVQSAIALRDELIEAASPDMPVLFALDGYNRLYGDVGYGETVVKDDKYVRAKLKLEQLPLASSFQMLKTDNTKAAHVVAAMGTGGVSPFVQMPLERVARFFVPRYSEIEVAHALYYYYECGLAPRVPTLTQVKKMLALTNGNAKEVRERAIRLTTFDINMPV